MAYVATKKVSLDCRDGQRRTFKAGKQLPLGTGGDCVLMDNVAAAIRMGAVRFTPSAPDEVDVVDELLVEQDARKAAAAALESADWFGEPVAGFPASKKAVAALKKAGIQTIGEVAKYSVLHDGDFTALSGIGDSTSSEIVAALAAFLQGAEPHAGDEDDEDLVDDWDDPGEVEDDQDETDET